MILQKVIKYERDKANAKTIAQQTRPRILMCHQISLDDVAAERRDKVCTFMYTTSMKMSELTSGVLKCRPIHVDIPSRPFGDLVNYL